MSSETLWEEIREYLKEVDTAIFDIERKDPEELKSNADWLEQKIETADTAWKQLKMRVDQTRRQLQKSPEEFKDLTNRMLKAQSALDRHRSSLISVQGNRRGIDTTSDVVARESENLRILQSAAQSLASSEKTAISTAEELARQGEKLKQIRDKTGQVRSAVGQSSAITTKIENQEKCIVM